MTRNNPMSTQKMLPNAGLSRAASHIAATHRPNLLRRSPQPSECEHHSMSTRAVDECSDSIVRQSMH
jgi:hypothetical protein